MVIQAWTFAACMAGTGIFFLLRYGGGMPADARGPYANDVVKRRHRIDVLGHRGHDGGNRDCPAAVISRPVLFSRSSLDEFRAAASPAHLRRHLRIWRQRPDCDVVLCRPANVQGAALRRCAVMVRVLGLQHLHRAGRHGLSARHHAGPRICRAGVVRRIWLTAVWVCYLLRFWEPSGSARNRISMSRTGSISPSSSPSQCCTSSTIWRFRFPYSTKSFSLFSGVQDALT